MKDVGFICLHYHTNGAIPSSPGFPTTHQLLLTMKKIAIFFLVGLGIVGPVACRADVSLSDETIHRATIAADGVQRVRIEGGSYFFKPNRVIVRVNVPVELSVSAGGLIPHTFVIQSPEAGIAVDQSLSGDAQTIRFTPSATGQYPFYCRNKLLFFKSHRENGMEGILEVVE